MSGVLAGLGVVAGCAVALLGYVWITWWRSSNVRLGQPTPTSARVVSEQLTKAESHANVETDQAIARTRELEGKDLLKRANALREKGRGR